ncbi:uncharacterized protein ASCRUDRAFT_77195, partial [Ascoidea rubescens DSM 1968]
MGKMKADYIDFEFKEIEEDDFVDIQVLNSNSNDDGFVYILISDVNIIVNDSIYKNYRFNNPTNHINNNNDEISNDNSDKINNKNTDENNDENSDENSDENTNENTNNLNSLHYLSHYSTGYNNMFNSIYDDIISFKQMRQYEKGFSNKNSTYGLNVDFLNCHGYLEHI